jgi:signal transduction histidine kinase
MQFTEIDSEMVRSTASVVQESVGEAIQLLDRVGFVLWASADGEKKERVDMAEIVTKSLRILDKKIQDSKAALEMPTQWPAAQGVASWLGVVWTNLISNSLEHAGPAPKIQLEWTAVPSGFQFSVTDSGPGVAAARMPELFTRFDKLHEIRGRGFGLSIVQRLVALQGGRYGHKNLPERGASFYFTLPVS